MRIDVRRLGDADVVLVAGSLDLATTPRLRAVLAARLAEGRPEIILDLAGLRFLDAGATGLLTHIAELAERDRGRFCAVGARGICLEVLQIVGLDKRLWAYDETDALIAHYRGDTDPDAGADTDSVDADSVDGERWPGSQDITVHALLSAAARLPAGNAARAELRSQAIEDSIGYAHRLAHRFRDRGEPIEDLIQVAMVGLVHAVDGYDPSRGCEFGAYATPTIVGEIRRYFRDKGWRIKVPRRLQELRLHVNKAAAELSQTQGRSPSNADVARHLEVTEDEVAEAIEVSHLYLPASLSSPPPGGEADATPADPLGDLDPGMAAVDDRESVKPLLAALPERERRILGMRFFGEMTQSQIASELGISQMHVSRLLTQTLARLRTALLAEDGAVEAAGDELQPARA